MIQVREADVKGESAVLSDFLSRFLSPQADMKRFEWLYLDNPAGLGKAWVATEAADTQIVGIAAAFPRWMEAHESTSTAYVLGDFCIHPDHRTLGPALTLQRACLEGLRREGTRFIYDFPSDTMLAVYRRLRVEVNGKLVRFAKPLSSDRIFEKRVSNKTLARGMSAIANSGLQVRDSFRRSARQFAIARQTQRCGEEFAAVTPALQGMYGSRTGAFLDWRYLRHPQQRYEVLTARRDGHLRAFMVLHAEGEDGWISDLQGTDDEALLCLVDDAIDACRTRKLQTLNMPCLASDPRVKFLEKRGFRGRESKAVVMMNPSVNCASERPVQWFLTEGDRES